MKKLTKDEKYVLEVIEKNIDSVFDILESDTFIASIYLLKYIDDGDLDCYNKFLELMAKFSYEERKQVYMNVFANLNNRKSKKEKDKTKVLR